MVVACSVDQRDVNIAGAAVAVAQTQYVCKELSTKIRSVSSLKFKSMSSIDYNNYLEGTRFFANELKGVRSRYCFFVCTE